MIKLPIQNKQSAMTDPVIIYCEFIIFVDVQVTFYVEESFLRDFLLTHCYSSYAKQMW